MDTKTNATNSTSSPEVPLMDNPGTLSPSKMNESEIQDGGLVGCSASKTSGQELEGNESCCSHSCTSEVYESELSDVGSALASLFHTPSTLSRSSGISSPGTEETEGSTLLDGIDVLLQRITSERFAELRNIQLTDRPVTGGQARGNIESFMRRAVHGPTEEEQIEERQANMPEHVTTERNFLREQSVVQNSLQNEFRSILERTLLARMSPGTSNTISNVGTIQEERQPVGGTTFRSRLESLFGNRVSSVTTPRTPLPNTTRRQNNTNNNNSSNNNINNISSNIPQPPSIPRPPPAVNHAVDHEPRTRLTIDAGMQLLAQSISDDLNRLESLHVVSGMLQGNFRDNLEQMVQTRISNETLAVRTQQLIRSLPGRRPHVSNPPQSHPNPPTISSSQAAINHGVTNELNSLKYQLEEMKRMLAMSMEIQMDTQRAVRQEVAAIFSSFAQNYAQQQQHNTNVVPLQTPVAPPVVSGCGQCVICCERDVDTVLYQCGHMCVCLTCGQQLKMDGHNCPMCRAPIRDVIRAYQTQTFQK